MNATAIADAKPPATDLDAQLIVSVRRFEEAEHITRDARHAAERDRDYRDGKQWTETEEKALRNRKQPVVTFNRVQRKVNALLGLERQTRKDPRAFPRTPNDEQAAQAATDTIRYVCDDQRWDEVRSEAADNLIVEGIGIVAVGVQEGEDGSDPGVGEGAARRLLRVWTSWGICVLFLHPLHLLGLCAAQPVLS